MKMKLKNKKAILMQEVLKIIVAVLSILILISLAVKLYGMSKKSELDKAQSNLKSFIQDFEGFMNGNEEKTNLTILGPKKWFISSFKRNDIPPIPNGCEGLDYCICLCYFYKGYNVGDCNKRGICYSSKYYLKIEKFGKRLYIDKVPYKIILEKEDNMGIVKNEN